MNRQLRLMSFSLRQFLTVPGTDNARASPGEGRIYWPGTGGERLQGRCSKYSAAVTAGVGNREELAQGKGHQAKLPVHRFSPSAIARYASSRVAGRVYSGVSI